MGSGDPLRRLASHLTHAATDRGGPSEVGDREFRWALEVSRYATQIDAYAEHWPRDTILPLVHETLVAEPEDTVRRALLFLGLSPELVDGASLERAHNTRVELAGGMTLARVLGDSPVLSSIQRWVPESAARVLRRAVGRWTLREIALTPGQRARALEVLRPEMARLRNDWAVDTSRWDPALDPGSGDA